MQLQVKLSPAKSCAFDVLGVTVGPNLLGAYDWVFVAWFELDTFAVMSSGMVLESYVQWCMHKIVG
jgi:hypothetical protein